MPEPYISCNSVDGAHQGLSAARQRPPPPSHPHRPRGNAWQPLTEHVSPRTGRGEAAASQPWRAGRGSEASSGRGCPAFPPAQAPRLPRAAAPQIRRAGRDECQFRAPRPRRSRLRGAHAGCVRSRALLARGAGGWGRAAGGGAPSSRNPRPAGHPPTTRAGSGL